MAASSMALARRGAACCRKSSSSSSTFRGRGGGRINGMTMRVVLASRRRAASSMASSTAGNGEHGIGRDLEAELPKNFDPLSREERLYQWWERNGFFKPITMPSSSPVSAPPFTLSMPPPNVTGKLHMGHAMFVTLQDVMARHARMQGRPTLWLPGTDHAGIATQLVVERQLREEEGLSRGDVGREAFVRRVWEWKDTYGGFITSQLRRLGASCDWSRERFTLDEGLSDAVLEAFISLHEKGLIYRGSYMVNWSPSLQTAVSDLEVEYSEETGTLYHFKYPLASGEGYLPVATSRPETILGDTAVAVHPRDARYKEMIGQECEVPMSGGRTIPIIADEYVDMEFGTGALKITPGHDPNDYELGKKFGLPIMNIMNKDGTLNAEAGPDYAGLDREEARVKLWDSLTEAGLALRTEPYETRVPRSQRGGEVIEPLVSEQWYVRMKPLAEPALKAVEDKTIKIVPERFTKIYNNWLTDIKDWCISRQLWWGHQIPVWYVHDSEEEAQKNPQPSGGTARYVVARNDADAEAKAREMYGTGKFLTRDPDVLDTWFSSGLWPFSTLGWPSTSSADYDRFYPTSVMETGHDILFFWVSRMVMMGLEFTGKAPFHTIYLHGLVRDDQGRKMSKTLGNVIDPIDVIEKYGADALRYALATGTTPGQDLNLQLERIDSARNFTNKIWNVSKFVIAQLTTCTAEEKAELAEYRVRSTEELGGLPLVDRWILSKLHRVANKVDRCLVDLEIGQAGRELYDFFWSDLADWYIEASKPRIYGANPGEVASTRRTLVYAVRNALKMLHPFMPFVTEELFHSLPHSGESLMNERWPGYTYGDSGESEVLPEDQVAVEHFTIMQELVRGVRATRNEYSAPPSKRIPAFLYIKDAELMEVLKQEATIVSTLAKLDVDHLKFFNDAVPSEEEMEDSVQIIVRDGVSVVLPLSGLADPAKEAERLSRQMAKVEKELSNLEKRLASKFVEKAPPEVVADVRAQAAELREQKAAIEERLVQMQRLAAV